jgi:hypothetical protein
MIMALPSVTLTSIVIRINGAAVLRGLRIRYATPVMNRHAVKARKIGEGVVIPQWLSSV